MSYSLRRSSEKSQREVLGSNRQLKAQQFCVLSPSGSLCRESAAGLAEEIETCSDVRFFILISLFQRVLLLVWESLSIHVVELAEAKLQEYARSWGICKKR